MSDDDHGLEPDSSLLASLFVDGEADADERALVETSADTLDEARRLGDVRSVLAATAPLAPLAAREAQLAAALDVWERMSDLERSGEGTPSDGIEAAAAAAVMTPAAGTRRERSPRRRRLAGLTGSQWLLGAAAMLMLIVAGGVVVGSFLADDDGGDDVAVESATEEPAGELSDLEAQEAAEVNGENVGDELDPAITDLSDEAAESGLFPDDGIDVSAERSASDDDAAEESSADVGEAQSLPGPEQPAPPPEDDIIEIEDVDDLAAYGGLAIAGLDAAPADNDDIDFEAPFGSCEAELGVDEELEPVVYDGTQVVVGIDLDRSLVLAYTADDCEIVESTPLPDDTEG